MRILLLGGNARQLRPLQRRFPSHEFLQVPQDVDTFDLPSVGLILHWTKHSSHAQQCRLDSQLRGGEKVVRLKTGWALVQAVARETGTTPVALRGSKLRPRAVAAHSNGQNGAIAPTSQQEPSRAVEGVPRVIPSSPGFPGSIALSDRLSTLFAELSAVIEGAAAELASAEGLRAENAALRERLTRYDRHLSALMEDVT